MSDEPRPGSAESDALRERLNGAVESLSGLLGPGQDSAYEAARLRGKVEGVKLALSYLDDMTRVTPPVPPTSQGDSDE